MKARKLIKKHRISNGMDWKKASRSHKFIYVGNALDLKKEVDVESQSFSALPGNVLVIIDGVGPIEMNAEMVGWLIKSGVFKVVGRSPFELDFDPDIFDLGI